MKIQNSLNALIISKICLSDGSGSPRNLLLSAAMARRLLHQAKDPAAILVMQDVAALGNKDWAIAESATPKAEALLYSLSRLALGGRPNKRDKNCLKHYNML